MGVSLLAATAGLLEGGPIPAWVGIAVAIAAIGSLAVDAFGGALLGIVVAAGLIGARRLTGLWTPEAFWPALVESLAIVVAAVIGGVVGTALRPTPPTTVAGGDGRLEPVFGSLGLLDHATAIVRLEEEIERAREHRRPLTLVLLEVQITDVDLSRDARMGAFRAVARLWESRLADTDVPFSIGEDRLGAILPETGRASAWQRLGAVLDGVADGRFMSRSQGVQRPLADVVEVRVGMAHLEKRLDHADALIDAASASLRRADGVSRTSDEAGR